MVRRSLTVSPELRELLKRLAVFFRERGIEAYLVGGFLRDAILGRESRDIDLSVGGDSVELGRALANAFDGSVYPLSQERGVMRVLLDSPSVYIDLLATDGDIDADLRRRDFTIDAMATALDEAAVGEAGVVDPNGGLVDLERRVIRALGADAFAADPLRSLRGVRLATELGFTLEPETVALVLKYSSRLGETAVERQRDELMRILDTPSAGVGVLLLDEVGLLDHLLPELTAARGVDQPKEHHWDVLRHCLEAVGKLDWLLAEQQPRGSTERDLWGVLWKELSWWDGHAYFREPVLADRSRYVILKLGALVHDIAKPETRTIDATGRMRFFGHSDVGAEVAGKVLRRLRFSAREVALVQTVVKAHLRPVQLGQQGPPSRRALYRYFRDCGEAAISTLFLSLADHLATVGPGVSMTGWRQHVSLVNYILTKRFHEEETTSPAKLLSGDELMAELALSPGPLVGRLLEAIREGQAAGEVNDREDALALARAAIAHRAREHQCRS